MFNKTVLSFALCYFLVWSTAAVSGPFTLSYTKCLLEKTTGYEEEILVRWIFTSLGTHPALANLMEVEQIERDEIEFDKINTAVFYSSGDSAPVDLAQFSISVKLLTGCNVGWDDNRSSVKLDPTQTASGCTVANTISSSELGELFVEVIDEQSGEGSKNSLVNISTNYIT